MLGSMNAPKPQSISGASFLVRIWWEARDTPGDPPVWRGRVEHVPSGHASHFDAATELLAFIEHWTGSLSVDHLEVTTDEHSTR